MFSTTRKYHGPRLTRYAKCQRRYFPKVHFVVNIFRSFILPRSGMWLESILRCDIIVHDTIVGVRAPKGSPAGEVTSANFFALHSLSTSGNTRTLLGMRNRYETMVSLRIKSCTKSFSGKFLLRTGQFTLTSFHNSFRNGRTSLVRSAGQHVFQ